MAQKKQKTQKKDRLRDWVGPNKQVWAYVSVDGCVFEKRIVLMYRRPDDKWYEAEESKEPSWGDVRAMLEMDIRARSWMYDQFRPDHNHG
jgi:hypothetical protein